MPNIKKSATTEFQKTETYVPKNEREELFIRALLTVKTPEDMTNFLRDLLTLPELEEFANRLTIAQMVADGQSYQKIAKEIGTSTTTVTRVAHWLYRGCGGYYKVVKKLRAKKAV